MNRSGSVPPISDATLRLQSIGQAAVVPTPEAHKPRGQRVQREGALAEPDGVTPFALQVSLLGQAHEVGIVGLEGGRNVQFFFCGLPIPVVPYMDACKQCMRSLQTANMPAINRKGGAG